MGKVREKTDMNKTQGRKFKAHCAKCGPDNNHIVVQSVDSIGSEVIQEYENDHPDTIDWENHHQIIRCEGCDTVSFRHVSWCSENREQIGYNEWSDGTSIQLYPDRSARMLPAKDFYSVPHSLRRIYRETMDCFNNGSYTLCAAGLRATIDGICADKKVANGPIEVPKKGGGTKTVRRKNIEGKIAGLCEKGFLTESNAKILHEHRYLGNEAVHGLDKPSADELVLAIQIMEHTLDALYEMPEKAEELRLKKAKRQKKHMKRKQAKT